MSVENLGFDITLPNFPGFNDVFIHMQILQPAPRPSGKINWLKCTKCMKSQRIFTEGESGSKLLCLCVQSDKFTPRMGVCGRERQKEAAHYDCIFQALTFFLLMYSGITQGQGHTSL